MRIKERELETNRVRKKHRKIDKQTDRPTNRQAETERKMKSPDWTWISFNTS